MPLRPPSPPPPPRAFHSVGGNKSSFRTGEIRKPVCVFTEDRRDIFAERLCEGAGYNLPRYPVQEAISSPSKAARVPSDILEIFQEQRRVRARALFRIFKSSATSSNWVGRYFYRFGRVTGIPKLIICHALRIHVNGRGTAVRFFSFSDPARNYGGYSLPPRPRKSVLAGQRRLIACKTRFRIPANKRRGTWITGFTSAGNKIRRKVEK